MYLERKKTYLIQQITVKHGNIKNMEIAWYNERFFFDKIKDIHSFKLKEYIDIMQIL